MPKLPVLVSGIALIISTSAAAAPDGSAARAPRIRPMDSRSAALMLEGLQRSETLRQLIDRIELGDVIAYVETRPIPRSRLAGLVTWMTKAGGLRYIRVTLSPELHFDRAIATLAHELQHTLEIVNQPSIVDDASLEIYYERHGIGTRTNNSWDTAAARDVEYEVRADLAGRRPVRSAVFAGGFDPLEWDLVYSSMRDRTR